MTVSNSFGKSVGISFAKYKTFNGRASRSEYWYFFLFGLPCYLVALSLDSGLKTGFYGDTAGFFYLVTFLVLFLPSLSLIIRRLHDTDHSGWWLLIAGVPLIGLIVMIIWMCIKGTEGKNSFGLDPLTETNNYPPPPPQYTAVSNQQHGQFCGSCGAPNPNAAHYCNRCAASFS